jgi:hypothetical protein
MSLSAVRFEPTRSCMQWILNPFCKHLGRLTTADLWLLRAMKFRCENACCAAIVFCCVGNEIGTRDGTRTRNLLLRREALYPLGHTSCCKMHKRANDHFRHRRATAGRGGRPCKGQRQRLQTRRRQQVPRWLLLLLLLRRRRRMQQRHLWRRGVCRCSGSGGSGCGGDYGGRRPTSPRPMSATA